MGSRTRVMKKGQNVRQLAQCFHTPACRAIPMIVSTGVNLNIVLYTLYIWQNMFASHTCCIWFMITTNQCSCHSTNWCSHFLLILIRDLHHYEFREAMSLFSVRRVLLRGILWSHVYMLWVFFLCYLIEKSLVTILVCWWLCLCGYFIWTYPMIAFPRVRCMFI